MYLIKNAVVYDPQPKGINDVLVVNDRIAAVGKDLNRRFQQSRRLTDREKPWCQGSSTSTYT